MARVRARTRPAHRSRRNPPSLFVLAAHDYPTPSEYDSPNGRYVRGVAHDLKATESLAIRHAAWALAPLVPRGATLVPVPSSRGSTASNLRLAEAIAKRSGARVADGMERAPGESQHARRKRGASALLASDQRVLWRGGALRDPVVLVDNVLTTGATATACAMALGRSVMVLVWADARRTA